MFNKKNKVNAVLYFQDTEGKIIGIYKLLDYCDVFNIDKIEAENNGKFCGFVLLNNSKQAYRYFPNSYIFKNEVVSKLI